MISAIPFALPPTNLRLGENEIRVFWASLDQSASRIEELASYLSSDEQARSARFRFEKDRKRFIAGRGMLREILGQLQAIDPERVTFSYGAHGKPALMKPPNGSALYFNLAHSDELVVYAFSLTHEVGVDVERIRPFCDMEMVAGQFLTTREIDRWRSFPSERRAEAFFNAWTCKEAIAKAIGEGLSEPLQQIELSFDFDEHSDATRFACDSQVLAGLSLQPLLPVPGYAGAVATTNQTSRITPRTTVGLSSG